jgi:trigger factor
MQVTELRSEGLSREFKISIPGNEINNKLDQQLEMLKDRIRLPGFRPGKAPLSLLRKLHGKSVIGQVLEETINASSQQALEDRSLRPALQPKIEITKFDFESGDGKLDLEYTMAVEVVPPITVPDFSKISLERLVAPVSDAEVTAEVERIAAQQKNFAPAVEGQKAAKGDAVVIDFVGSVDGVEFEGGKAEGYQLELGSGSFIPGFEDQLIGAKAGDEVTVKVDFPENYHAKDLAGKAAEFACKVKEVRVAEAVVANDDFAKTLGFDSLKALEDRIRESLEADVKSMSRARLKRSLLDALAETEKFEVPAGMVELEFQQIWQQVMEDLHHQAHMEHGDHGHDHDHEHCNHEIEEPGEEVKAEYRAIADRRVRLGLLLAEVGQQNKITVPQDEVTRAIAREARRFPGQEKRVFEFYQNNPQAMAQIRAPIYEDKVVDFILELVKLTDKTVTRQELLKALQEDEEAATPKEEAKKPAKKTAKKAAKSEDAAEGEAAEAGEKPKAAKKTTKKAKAE